VTRRLCGPEFGLFACPSDSLKPRSGTPHRTATGPSASSRPPRGLCATRPPWRFVACLPADLTEVGQCVSPSPASPSVLPEATTKLVRHARPPSLPSQPTPVVIACPREEAEHRRGVRGEPSNVTNGLLSPVSRRCRAQASLLLVPPSSSARFRTDGVVAPPRLARTDRSGRCDGRDHLAHAGTTLSVE
jgi:hypothetical protein